MKTYEIGEVVYVLCRHRDWGTPSLIKTTVAAVVMSNDRLPRFANLTETEIVVEIFSERDRLAAISAYAEADKMHKQSKDSR